jgi:hypothetical protein
LTILVTLIKPLGSYRICRPAVAALLAATAALLGIFPVAAQTNQVTLAPGSDIQQAVASNPGNTTFVITPGTYRLQQIQPKDGDIFIGQPGAILSGAQLLTTFTRVGNLWAVYGQIQQGQQNGYCDPQHPACTHPEDLFFDNNPLLHVDNLSSVAHGGWFFDYANHVIYFADDPTGHTVETSTARSAFSGPAQNVTIRGLTIEKYAVPAQMGAIGDQYPGPGWTITNNEVRWNHGAGINMPSGGQANQNYVHHNGQKGMGGSGNNTLVQDNEISFNNWAGFDPNWETGGAKFALTNGLILRRNYVHDNIGPGLWTDIDNINTLYENNVILNNTGPGIQHEISYTATIRYNIVRYNSAAGTSWLWGSQISIQNSQGVEVYGNTVEAMPNGGNGIGIIQQNRGSGAYGPYLAMNNYIHNNTIIYRQGSAGVSGEIADYQSPTLVTNGNNRFDYNAYHLVDISAVHFVWGGWATWSAMQAAGQELHGTLDTVIPPISGN